MDKLIKTINIIRCNVVTHQFVYWLNLFYYSQQFPDFYCGLSKILIGDLWLKPFQFNHKNLSNNKKWVATENVIS